MPGMQAAGKQQLLLRHWMPAGQLPQDRVCPQLLVRLVPHVRPLQDGSLQFTHMLFWHCWLAPHIPQLMV
jgi:hypothetical protein